MQLFGFDLAVAMPQRTLFERTIQFDPSGRDYINYGTTASMMVYQLSSPTWENPGHVCLDTWQNVKALFTDEGSLSQELERLRRRVTV